MSDRQLNKAHRPFPQTIGELLALLVERGCMTGEQSREVEVKHGQQRARIIKARRDAVGRNVKQISVEPSPAEIIDSFDFHTPENRMLDEDRIMQEISAVTG